MIIIIEIVLEHEPKISYPELRKSESNDQDKSTPKK